jgi:hypothetical protein
MATPADEIAGGCLIKKSIHGLMKRAIKQEHSPKTQDLDPLDPLQRRVNALLVAKRGNSSIARQRPLRPTVLSGWTGSISTGVRVANPLSQLEPGQRFHSPNVGTYSG